MHWAKSTNDAATYTKHVAVSDLSSDRLAPALLMLLQRSLRKSKAK